MSMRPSRTLAIIGQGYVGLPLAMAAVEAGWDVVGIDKIESRVNQINSGISPVEDISDLRLQLAIRNGMYKATVDFSKVEQASVVTICVPTPLNEKREPDLTLLRDAATQIAPFIRNETLIVSESTSYPGTLRDVIIPIITTLKPNDSAIVYFATAPERVNPGDKVWDQRNTPRLIGGINSSSQSKAMEFYSSICEELVSVSTPEIAEAAKLLENTFRLVNIALVNELATLCSGTGISVYEVIEAASTKPYGFMPFRPSVGVGGHCIPIDPLYLTWWAQQHGVDAPLISAADHINRLMPNFVATRALSFVDIEIKTPRVLILGVAYKPGVGDVRETPASELRRCLIEMGAIVAWYDPLVPEWEDSNSVEIDWECDIAILAINQVGIDVEPLIQRGVTVLDCTNSILNRSGVNQL